MVEYIIKGQKEEIQKENGYIIKAYHLTKKYNDGEPSMVTAIDNLTFGIETGRMIAIAGPSGSGKSTLLNILGCMDSTTTGQAFIDNIEVTKLTESELSSIRKNKIGFVFQDFLLIPTLSAIENVLLPRIPDGISKNDREEALSLLEQVGLAERANHKPKELSGGEKQRVAIARALINNPKIIFADEPTGNLDTKTGDEIITILRQLNETLGVTIVIVTHDKEVMEKMDLILNLKDGKIVNT
jgi:putative ABC transport system ATP-binding protein